MNPAVLAAHRFTAHKRFTAVRPLSGTIHLRRILSKTRKQVRYDRGMQQALSPGLLRYPPAEVVLSPVSNFVECHEWERGRTEVRSRCMTCFCRLITVTIPPPTDARTLRASTGGIFSFLLWIEKRSAIRKLSATKGCVVSEMQDSTKFDIANGGTTRRGAVAAACRHCVGKAMR